MDNVLEGVNIVEICCTVEGVGAMLTLGSCTVIAVFGWRATLVVVESTWASQGAVWYIPVYQRPHSSALNLEHM